MENTSSLYPDNIPKNTCPNSWMKAWIIIDRVTPIKKIRGHISKAVNSTIVLLVRYTKIIIKASDKINGAARPADPFFTQPHDWNTT